MPLYTSKKRYFFVTGGRGSVKSTSVHEFIVRLTYEKGHGILMLRYTFKSAEESIIQEFNNTITRLGLQRDFRVTKRKIFNRKTGSFVLFSGVKTSQGDQTANLKSIPGITTLVIEEGEEFVDEKKFDQIDDSIRSRNAQNRVIFIMNPTTRLHWTYKRWIEPHTVVRDVQDWDRVLQVRVSGHPDVEHIHTTYHIAARWLQESWLKKAIGLRKTDHNHYYNNYIGGWVEQLEGAVIKKWGYYKEFPQDLEWWYGQDFGHSPDPTTLTRFAIDEPKKLFYWDNLLYEHEMSTHDIIDANKSLMYSTDLPLICDSAEKRLIYDMRNEGLNAIPCIKGPDSIGKGLKDLEEYTVLISKEDDKSYSEICQYVYGKIPGKPIDQFNHIVDPARYVISEHKRNLG